MSRMEGPSGVRRHEIPALNGHAIGNWILLDVGDGATDLVGMVEEDLPSAGAPGGVIGGSEAVGAKPRAAVMLQMLDHILGAVAVLADDQVDMVEEDGAGIAGVLSRADRICESVRDALESLRHADRGGDAGEWFSLVHKTFEYPAMRVERACVRGAGFRVMRAGLCGFRGSNCRAGHSVTTTRTTSRRGDTRRRLVAWTIIVFMNALSRKRHLPLAA